MVGKAFSVIVFRFSGFFYGFTRYQCSFWTILTLPCNSFFLYKWPNHNFPFEAINMTLLMKRLDPILILGSPQQRGEATWVLTIFLGNFEIDEQANWRKFVQLGKLIVYGSDFGSSRECGYFRNLLRTPIWCVFSELTDGGKMS